MSHASHETPQTRSSIVFSHPETGQILETREEFTAALSELEERLAPLYRVRRLIRENAAERFDAPDMPRPARRTAKQDLVVRCPRCGQSYKNEDETV